MDVGPKTLRQCKKLNEYEDKKGEVIKDGYIGKYYYSTDYEDTTKAVNVSNSIWWTGLQFGCLFYLYQ